MRSWEMTMTLPGKAAMAVSSEVIVSTSRSLVGSSAECNRGRHKM